MSDPVVIPKPRASRSPELAEQICSLLQQGFSLRYSAINLGFSLPFVLSWLREDKEFASQYTRARENQAELLADRIVEIADAATPETANVARLQVDSRKWVAAKLLPKKYGDNAAQVNFNQTNVVIAMSVEEQKALQDRRRKLLEG